MIDTKASMLPNPLGLAPAFHLRLHAVDGVPLNHPTQGPRSGLLVEAISVIEGDAGPEVHVTVWGETFMVDLGMTPHTSVKYDVYKN